MMPTSLVVSSILFVVFCALMLLSEFRYRRRERKNGKTIAEHVEQVTAIAAKRKPGSKPPGTRAIIKEPKA